MYCPKCGAQNDDSAEFCTSCGNSLKAMSPESSQKPITTPIINDNNLSNVNYDKVPNYLVWSIIVTVLSVLLFNVFAIATGIVSIVFSTQVDSKLKTEDYDGAVKSSKNAKIWCWVTTGLEILSVILGLLILGLIIVRATQYSI